MPEPRLRHSVRGLIVDENEHVLLCRIDSGDRVVWVTPGGGIEAGESDSEALARELLEEVGFVLEIDVAHAWHQVLIAPHHAVDFDGVINDFYFIRTANFEPEGAFTIEQLAAENLIESRWWSIEEIQTYVGDDVFGPRALAQLLSDLLRDGVPERPVLLPHE